MIFKQRKNQALPPPLKSSGTQRNIDAISLNSNKSRLLVTQNNNLYFLQLEDLLYSSDSQIELKVNDFIIPFDTKDIAALKNNYVKEFEIKEVAKVIENTPPDFIKSEITKDDATLKLQKEESNKKTNILEKEVIIEDKSEFDYTQKQEKVEQKTYIQKDDKQNSSTLITEIIPQQTEKLEQKQIKETEEIQNKEENLVTEFVKPDLPKTTQIAQTTKKSQSNKTEKFPQENQKDYKESDNENRPIIVVNNTTDSNSQQNTKNALNNQKSDENLDKPQQSQKKDKDNDKDKKEFSRQKQFIVIGATAGTAPKPFNFAVGLNVGYENFKLIYPFYFGALIKPKIAFSSPENFPYHYKTQKGDNFLIPSLINAQLMAEIGYCLATKKDLDILISLCLGANASTMWNINFASSVASQFYFSFCTEANVGVAYKNCYVTINASYDAMFGFSFGGGFGFSIKLGK